MNNMDENNVHSEPDKHDSNGEIGHFRTISDICKDLTKHIRTHLENPKSRDLLRIMGGISVYPVNGDQGRPLPSPSQGMKNTLTHSPESFLQIFFPYLCSLTYSMAYHK